MNRHVLKTVGTVWDAVKSGEKRFEFRKNDRFFQRGDIVVLRRLNTDGVVQIDSDMNTLDLEFTVGWMLHGGQVGVPAGYCVFALDPLEHCTPQELAGHSLFRRVVEIVSAINAGLADDDDAEIVLEDAEQTRAALLTAIENYRIGSAGK